MPPSLAPRLVQPLRGLNPSAIDLTIQPIHCSPIGGFQMTVHIGAVRRLAALVAVVATSGCATLPQAGGPIINRYGPTDTSAAGLAHRFNQSATSAAGATATPAQIHAMLLDGFSLVY